MLAYIIGVAFVVGVVLMVRHFAQQEKSDRAEGITRYGSSTLKGQTLTIRGVKRQVTSGTRAEVTGAVQEQRRSTVTRTLAGGAALGPVGAIAGHAAKKKTSTSNAMLTIDGDDWADSIPIGAKQYDYQAAVRFAQAVNLAARTSNRR